ncbi:hypothetical protein Ctha_0700 [Chloroherpeton thalassium ATCC 35110]|uniref:TonB family protein n=1 Tax=Chloroherpeton thalassium (strain ATCC 35110 / GB-78) TaxID=517418 RepID=B3QVW2_CHLT3|nr:hypothetical protein [Chloroherpeton thalassium]ACF13169.1 hypothetical protein Ctha_0700 [Chloroherpeton thalassium ATCC 35110]
MRLRFSTALVAIAAIGFSGMLFSGCSGCSKKGDDADLLKPDSAAQVDYLKQYEKTLAEPEQQDKAGLIKKEYSTQEAAPQAEETPTTTAKTTVQDPYDLMEPVLDDLENKLSPIIDRAWRQRGLKGYIEFDLQVGPDGRVAKFNLVHSDVDAATLSTVKAIARSTRFEPHDEKYGNMNTPPLKFLSP